MARKLLIACSFCLALWFGTIARAALRVDIDPDVARKDILTPGWQSWKIHQGTSASQNFGDITITLRASADPLVADWWKGGYDTHATLASDGVFVRGGEMQLSIHGLSPGKHTIVTYHNSIWAEPISSFSVDVDGATKQNGIRPSQRVENDADMTTASVSIEAQADKDVVLTFKPDANAKLDNVILNALTIDLPDPAQQARKSAPASNDEHAPENAVLSWTAPKSAVSHQLYFGTDKDAVTSATRESNAFKGDIAEPKFQTSSLNSFDTYFWRVDELDASRNVTKGDVWSFRVRHLAFPGAEGYGRLAIGGRGGRVIEVTNLKDSGPGSLREAVAAEGPRTIVFRVGGTIHLQSKLNISNPYCTIAGQTAPGEGIATRGFTFGAGGTHDVILRYMRIRIGDESGETMDGCGLGGCDHCIVDHCSIAWSIDEAFSSRGAHNITLQRTIITEPLNMSVHSHYIGTGKGHSFAGSISGDIGSFHHNLLANCAGRNWSLAGGLTRGGKFAGYLDIRNNVVFNWAHRTNDGGVRMLNLVGNDYIPGPASRVFHLLLAIEEMKLPDDYQQYYVADNVMEGHPEYDADNWKNGGVKFDADLVDKMKLYKPFCEPFVTTQSAKDAYASVVADVVNWPKSDSIDTRAIRDTVNRTTTFKGSKTGMPGIIDSQKDVGDYADLKGGDAPTDSDHDGMPDEWEKSHGLNPADPSDGSKDSAGDGYTNLERYLNSIVQFKGK